MARSRKHGRDKWAEAEAFAAPSDVRQRLVDVALGQGPVTPALAADAANEIERLRSAVQRVLNSEASMGWEDIEVLVSALEPSV
jgi:hypothetical protein